jgi:hypothetical protein
MPWGWSRSPGEGVGAPGKGQGCFEESRGGPGEGVYGLE